MALSDPDFVGAGAAGGIVTPVETAGAVGTFSGDRGGSAWFQGNPREDDRTREDTS